ncbi:MAG: methyltransferase [Pseudomonadota bacterium]
MMRITSVDYRISAVFAVAVLLGGCGGEPDAPEASAPAEVAAEQPAAPSNTELLNTVLAAQPEEAQARYPFRNPGATLSFFGIKPGMTVVEALPGGGWYSKILIPYLGADGQLVGVDYAMDMWPLFGGMSEEAIEKRKTWTTTWVEGTREWGEGASVSAFVFGSVDETVSETADAVLMIRALHNLNRFEPQGGFRTQALTDAFDVLKPGGVLGIVQHRAPADASDDWADGSNGYLKQASVIEAVEAVGFELVESSEINANKADVPTEDDFVWRLPPTLGTSRDDETLRAEMTAIGESDRMTLKFRKPAASSGD